MKIQYIDDGYFFSNEIDFFEFVEEDEIQNYKRVKIRDFWEDIYNNTIKTKQQ